MNHSDDGADDRTAEVSYSIGANFLTEFCANVGKCSKQVRPNRLSIDT